VVKLLLEEKLELMVARAALAFRRYSVCVPKYMPSEQDKKRSVEERATWELKKFAVLAVYLWVFLGVFEIHRTLVLRRQVPGLELSYRTGFALVKALVLAKFMLIADLCG